MALRIDPNSYLLFSELLNVDGVEFWDLVQFPVITPQDDDMFITIGVSTQGQFISNDESIRPDLLSLRLYGNPQLWWVIALRNNFELMPSELNLGETIICPSPRYVFEEILTKARG